MKNTKIAKNYLEAAYSNEIEKAKSFLSENITLRMGGENALAGTYTGKDEFFGAFGKMLEMSNYTYKMIEQVEWLEGENRTILMTIEQVEKNGKEVAFERVVDYKIENSLISEITIYEAQPEKVDILFN